MPIIRIFFPRILYRLNPYAPILARISEQILTTALILNEFQKYNGKSVTEKIVI